MAKILSIGNAIYDIFSHSTSENIKKSGITIGSMQLIDDINEFHKLENDSLDKYYFSGGSCINTAATFAKLGGSASVIVKLGNDEIGKLYKKDLERINIKVLASYCNSFPTGKSRIYINEVSERSMYTYLGATGKILPEDVDFSRISNEYTIFLESYMFDNASELMHKLANHIHKNNIKCALTLSDFNCVIRNFDKIQYFISKTQPIVFANEKELSSYGETNEINLIIKTSGDKGSSIIQNGNLSHSSSANKVNKIVDLTGAGDVFAGAFMFFYLKNSTLDDCLQKANFYASQVIQKIGARI